MGLFFQRGAFIQRGELYKSAFTDFLKSKRAERQWSRHHLTMKWAIERQAHTPEGRKHHRMLGTFLATRPQYAVGSLFGSPK